MTALMELEVLSIEKKQKPMLARLLERLRNTTSNNSGSSLIWGMFFTVGLILISMIVFEKYRINIVANEVSNDIRNTLTSTASSNMYKSYSSVKEGTSGTYIHNGTSFTEIKDTSKFINLFVSIYKGTSASGSNIIKQSDSKDVFKISNIRLAVTNADGDNKRSVYTCEYTLTIYLDLFWRDKVIVLGEQKQTSKYVNKF